MANARPKTFYATTAQSVPDQSQYSIYLTKEEKQTLLQLANNKYLSLCTAPAQVFVKTESEQFKKSGHLCLVKHHNDVKDEKYFYLYCLERRELIWKQKLSVEMQVSRSKKNELTLKLRAELHIQLMFKTEYEAEEFHNAWKISSGLAPDHMRKERTRPPLQQRSSYQGILDMLGSSVKHFRRSNKQMNVNEPHSTVASLINAASGVMTNIDKTLGLYDEEHEKCTDCIHTCDGKKEQETKFKINLSNDDIGAPFNVKLAHHVGLSCYVDEENGFVAPVRDASKEPLKRSLSKTFRHTLNNVIESQKSRMTDHTKAQITVRPAHEQALTVNETLPSENTDEVGASEQHACADCVHSIVWESTDSRLPKHSQNLSYDDIGTPFNIKHICHVNPNCKYLKDKEFVGCMPSLVRAPSMIADGQSQVKTKIKAKFSKDDIGQPFDFKHVEGTTRNMTLIDKDPPANDSAEDDE